MSNNATTETVTGACHCRAVTYTCTLTPPLSEQLVDICDCSHCHIQAYILTYPPLLPSPSGSPNLITFTNKQHLRSYTFATHQLTHLFCPTCGTSVGGEFVDKGYTKEGDDDPAFQGGRFSLNAGEDD